MKLIRTTLVSLLLLVLALALSNCNKNSSEQSKKDTTASELLPPPPTHQPSRPSRPAPEPNQATTLQAPISGAFAPHPRLEEILNSPINNSLFPFNFDQPGEMSPPRQLVFSGVLNTSLSMVDFPVFEIQLWSNDPQYTDPIFNSLLTFEQEMQGVFSFQLTTPAPLAPNLYYYLVKDENEKRYYANKVIVDY